MDKLNKQNSEHASGNPERDNFNADEIGEQSIYEDTTEAAQQMRRGDETQGDADERDVVGAGTEVKGDNQNSEK
jgi:hypothetical protein